MLALPLPADGSSASVTPTELYMRFCGPSFLDGDAALRCERCGRCTKHVEQRRIRRSPKVLAVHFQRSVGAGGQEALRRAVDLEFEVVWPQMPSMELHSVVYHRGVDATKGQYTAAARCVQKRLWRFEDDRLCREVVGDVSKLLPTQIVMAFYEAVSGKPSSSPRRSGAAGGPRDAGAGGLPGADSGLSWFVAVRFIWARRVCSFRNSCVDRAGQARRHWMHLFRWRRKILRWRLWLLDWPRFGPMMLRGRLVRFSKIRCRAFLVV